MITEVPRATAWTPPVGARPDYTHPLMRGLVGWWPLNDRDGVTARDVSVLGNHGTLLDMSPSTDWIATRLGRGLNFGSGGTTRVETTYPGVLGSQNRTISLWINTANASSEYIGYGRDNDDVGGGLGERVTLRTDSGGQMRVEVAGGFKRGNTDIRNDWHHLAFVLDGTDVDDFTLYLDGVDDGGSSSSQTIDTQALHDVTFGIDPTDQPGSFTGKLRDIRFWDRALSASEIQQLYQDPWAPFRRSRPVVFSAGGGGSIIPQIMHHRRMMGVS